MKKRVLKIVCIGLLVGLALVAVQEYFKIDHDLFMKWYIVAAVVFLAAVVAVNVIYNNGYRKKVAALLPLLKENRTEEYIKGMEALEETAKGERLREGLRLNIAAGYSRLKQYDRSIPILEELLDKPMSGFSKVVLRHNLCLDYFYSGQTERALELYDKSAGMMEKYKDAPDFGGPLAALKIRALIAGGRKTEARELLEEAEKRWTSPSLEEDYKEIKGMLEEKKMNDEINPVLTLAEEGDLDEIHALCRLAADKTQTTDWDEEYPSREILAGDIAARALYKVVHEGSIISIMLIRPWADYIADDEAEDITTWDDSVKNPCAMARFCVTPKLQGHGLGRKTMLASIAKARELGYDGIRFHASKANPLVLHLYDSIGYHRAGEVSEYGCDFICYEMIF